MALVPGANPSGTFTDTLLQFEERSVEVPPEAAPFFPQGIPDPTLGTWYRGTVETADIHHNPLDNDDALGIFWAKLWAPAPAGTGPKTAILLFQYNFAVPGLTPTNHSGVRIFAGNLWEDEKHGTTFHGSGFDNWAGHTQFAFTLTQEPWPQS